MRLQHLILASLLVAGAPAWAQSASSAQSLPPLPDLSRVIDVDPLVGAAQEAISVKDWGRLEQITRRLTELRRALSGRVTLVDYRLFRNHEFLEVCMHTLLRRFRLHKPEETTELFQVQPGEVFQALDACHAGWAAIQTQYRAKK